VGARERTQLPQAPPGCLRPSVSQFSALRHPAASRSAIGEIVQPAETAIKGSHEP
jgi:hypothetical protein